MHAGFIANLKRVEITIFSITRRVILTRCGNSEVPAVLQRIGDQDTDRILIYVRIGVGHECTDTKFAIFNYGVVTQAYFDLIIFAKLG